MKPLDTALCYLIFRDFFCQYLGETSIYLREKNIRRCGTLLREKMNRRLS